MNIQENILLSPFTTFGIGGIAKYFLEAKDQQDLIGGVKWAKEKNLPFLIIGQGSNLLISDEGFSGLVIKNESSGIKENSDEIIIQAGTKLAKLVDYCIENGLKGIEKMAGIPGTVGGAIRGNAGAYGQTISDYLTEVACFNPSTPLRASGEIILLPKDQCEFNYRESIFKKNNLIVLEAYFKFPKGDSNLLSKASLEILAQRMAKYPQGLKCPGSFFKNIPVKNIPADKLKLIPKDKIVYEKVPVAVLLDLVRAKGQTIGDIEVSSFHANLIINKGQGKAHDVWQLAQELVKAVKEKFGIDLEPEVQFINLPPLYK